MSSDTTKSRLDAFKSLEFMGIPIGMFAIICAILWISMGFGWLEPNYFSLFAFLLSVALPLRWIGDHTPFLGKYVGFGPLLTIFGPSVLVLIGYITPEMQQSFTELRDNVLNPTNIAMLMCGSVLGRLDRKLLLKAIFRYIPVLLLSLGTTIGVACLIGPLLGYDLFNSLVVYAFPIFSGGSSGPLVSIPAMLNEAGIDGDALIGVMVAAMSLANIEAIVLSGLLDTLGRIKPSWTGNGNLVRTGSQIEVNTEHAKFDGKISSLLCGILFGAVLFAFANIIAYLTSPFINLNYIVWLILLCIILSFMPYLTGCHCPAAKALPVVPAPPEPAEEEEDAEPSHSVEAPSPVASVPPNVLDGASEIVGQDRYHVDALDAARVGRIPIGMIHFVVEFFLHSFTT